MLTTCHHQAILFHLQYPKNQVSFIPKILLQTINECLAHYSVFSPKTVPPLKIELKISL